jgi:hypothetical protein
VKRSNNHAFSFERKRNFNDLKIRREKELIKEEVKSLKNA